MEKDICHDCGAKEGELHNYGCDMERCPFCGGQLATCSCKYSMLEYNYDWNAKWCGLPKEVYENGLPKEKEKAWMGALGGIRVPWIQYPNLCIKCGKLWPDMFSVPTQEWNHYIEKNQRNKVICRQCYDFIKDCIDSK